MSDLVHVSSSEADGDITVSIDVREIVATIKSLPKQWKRSIENAMRRYARNEAKAFRDSGQIPERTGTAKKAVGGKVLLRPDEIVVKISASLQKAPHWPILDRGGLIRPSQGPNLAIPISTSPVAGTGTRARDFIDNPEAFGFVDTVMGANIIYGKEPNGNLVPVYALKSEVLFARSASKHFGTFFAGRGKEFEKEIMAAIQEGIEKAVMERV